MKNLKQERVEELKPGIPELALRSAQGVGKLEGFGFRI